MPPISPVTPTQPTCLITSLATPQMTPCWPPARLTGTGAASSLNLGLVWVSPGLAAVMNIWVPLTHNWALQSRLWAPQRCGWALCWQTAPLGLQEGLIQARNCAIKDKDPYSRSDQEKILWNFKKICQNYMTEMFPPNWAIASVFLHFPPILTSGCRLPTHREPVCLAAERFLRSAVLRIQHLKIIRNHLFHVVSILLKLKFS